MKLKLNSDLIIDHASENTAEDNHGMGRVVSVDHRDRMFLAAPPSASAITRRSRHWITGPVLDQGRLPHCVAYSGEQMLVSSPVKNKMYKTPLELYDECQANDGWEGNAYEGTSVRALMKVLKDAGYISVYEWAFDVERTVRQVLEVGPVVIGVNWYSDMMSADTKGFIHPTGPIVGGHAIMVKGLNLDMKCTDGTTGAFRLINSWSERWADGGKCWLSLSAAAKLISEWGEVAVAKELKFQPQN